MPPVIRHLERRRWAKRALVLTPGSLGAAGLAPSNPTSTTVTLSWSAATDNVAVTGYDLYRDRVKLGTTPAPPAHSPAWRARPLTPSASTPSTPPATPRPRWARRSG
jgi:hypothetical protein